MKHFKKLLKSSVGNNITCGFHNENALPDLRPIGIWIKFIQEKIILNFVKFYDIFVNSLF